jgi:hypothetical protein
MKSPNSDALEPFGPSLTLAMRSALVLLLEAHDIALSLGLNKWDFALEIDAIKDEAGVNQNDLRFLICNGLAEHLVDRTRTGAKRRAFRQPRGLRLHTQSCFTLSDSGLSVAQKVLVHQRCSQNPRHVPNGHPDEIVPFWDSQRRELRIGDILVKRFRQPARNQETILAVFQEDGWPPRIDNPIAGGDGQDAQDRLHASVRRLNLQSRPLIRFQSDGTGEGILWQPVSAQGLYKKRTKSGP